MSNDIINHLDAREKELWAELEKIDATRKLWQGQSPASTTQHKQSKPKRMVQIPIRKLVGKYDPYDLKFVTEHLGGVDYIRQCERNAKQNRFLMVAKFGELGYRITLHNFGVRSKTGKTEKKLSVGYYNSLESANTMLEKIMSYYRQQRNN